MKKKKNVVDKKNSFIIGALVWIIIILVVFIALIFAKLISVDKILNDNQSNENSTVMSNSDAKYLVSKYMYDYNNFWYQPLDISNLLRSGLTDRFKVFITIMNADNIFVRNEGQKEEIDCLKAFPNATYSKIDFTDNAYNFVFEPVEDGSCFCGIKDYNNYGGKYDYAELNVVYKYLFGNDTNLPKTYVSRSLSFYAYSEYYNAYIYLQRWGGGPTYIYQYYDVSSVKEDKDILEINIKFLEFDYRSNNEKVIYESKSGNKYNYTSDELYGVDVEYDYAERVLKDIYNKEYNYLDEYKFTFVKDSNHYYLKSINKV